MHLVNGPPRPRPRRRALALVEAEIARAEAVCTRWRTQAAALEAAGRSGRSTYGLLLVAEQRLAQLHRSREVLWRGEEGHEDDDFEHQP
jgi:hypothetical protein